MKKTFGVLPSGEATSLYTISCGGVTADVTDYGAALVNLFVPGKDGIKDVTLGFDDCEGYRLRNSPFLGATVGRSGNRIGGARFSIGGKEYQLQPNEGKNNLHSGPDFYHLRLWEVVAASDTAVTFGLHSPDGDQGFPGNAYIKVTYSLDSSGGLHIVYDAESDQDTIFNLTNHSYFNLAGHDQTGKAMDQILTINADFFNPDDAESIPTGVLQSVEGTPMDFRTPKAIGRDINADFEPLHLQGGYDHNWVIAGNPCATLKDEASGRVMEVYTDCPGVQFYAGNFVSAEGKGGIAYGKRSGIALETQYYPDAIHNPTWPQPVTKAGQPYHSETIYKFSW